MGKLKATQLHTARAAANVLSAPHAANIFYHADLLADIINLAGDINNDNRLSGKNVTTAFCGDYGDDYEIDYDDIELNLGDCPGIGKGDFLCVRRNARVGKNDRVCIIGRFQSKDALNAAGESTVQCVGNATGAERFARSSKYPMMDRTKKALQQKLNKKRTYNTSGTGGASKRSKTKTTTRQQQCSGEDNDASRRREEAIMMERRRRNALIEQITQLKNELLRAAAALKDFDDTMGGITRATSSSNTQSPPTTDEESTESDSDDTTTSSPTANSSSQQQQQQQCDRVKLLFVMGEKAGCIDICPDSVITYDDILNSTVNEDKASTDGFTIGQYGSNHCWVPNRAILIGKHHFTRLSNKADKVTQLESYFKGSRCTLPQESRNILAAGAILSFGGSDESVVMMMNATAKALLHAMGLYNITNEAISKGMPSRDSVKADENCLASMVKVVKRQEMRDDGATVVGLQCDHGKRGDVNHFPQVYSWPGRNQNGELQIKIHVVSSNHSGDTAQESADAVKHARDDFCSFDGPDETIDIISATSDTGGGGAIQHIHPKMITNGAMTSDSVTGNCLLHGVNKAFEWAAVRVFGAQGIGYRTLWQMLYVWRLLMKRSKSDNDGINLDEMWKAVVQKLRTEGDDWQTEAKQNFPQAFHKWLKDIKDLEDAIIRHDSEGKEEEAAKAREKLSKMIEQRQKGKKDPVFSRWQTIEDSAYSLADNLPPTYFFCVAVIQSKKSSDYCKKLAKSFLSLLNTRTVAEVDAADVINDDEDILDEIEQSANDLVEAQSTDSNLDELRLQPGQTPILWAQLLFTVGFCEYFQTDHFEWLKKNDPFFAGKSFGYLSRFVLERLAVIHFDLLRLEDGGYKTLPQFARFMESLDGIHDGSVNSFGKDYFDKAPKVFIEVYRKGVEKHMIMRWLTSDKIHYLLGGDAVIAKHLSRWILHYHDSVGVDIDDDAVAERCHFPNTAFELGKFHNTSRGPVELNLPATMEFLLADIDPTKVLETPLVKENIELLRTLAESTQPITLFDKTEESWGGLTPSTRNLLSIFQLTFAKLVCTHAHHQQICERYVNTVSLVSQTGVSETRRQDRTEIISGLHRPGTQHAIEVTGKKRIQGADRARYHFDEYDRLKQKFDRAVEILGRERFNPLRKRRISREKQSDKEKKENLEAFMTGLNAPRNVTKGEMPTTAELTATMGGLVILRLLSKKNDDRTSGLVVRAVAAELTARGIILSEEESTNLSLKERVHKIRYDEYKKLKAEKEGIKKETDVSYVCPESDELRVFLTDHQETILNS